MRHDPQARALREVRKAKRELAKLTYAIRDANREEMYSLTKLISERLVTARHIMGALNEPQ